MSSSGDLSPGSPDPDPARQLHFPELGRPREGKRRCRGIRADGARCRAWAVRGSDPPLCAAHSGQRAALSGAHPEPLEGPEGADAGGRSGGGRSGQGRSGSDLTHIEAVVADLAERQAQLTRYLAALMERGADVEEVARLFALHGQNASRLGRLLRDQHALSGESTDGLLDAIGQALDEISAELGVEL